MFATATLPDAVLSRSAAARRAGVSPETIRIWTRRSVLPYQSTSLGVLMRVADLDRFVAERAEGARMMQTSLSAAAAIAPSPGAARFGPVPAAPYTPTPWPTSMKVELRDPAPCSVWLGGWGTLPVRAAGGEFRSYLDVSIDGR